jgi:hypothetical protein
MKLNASVLSKAFGVCLLAASLTFTAAGAAAPTTLYSTSFEASEGYQPGEKLVGQNNWAGAGSGGDGIVTNFFTGQVQSAYIGFGAPAEGETFHGVGRGLDFLPAERGLPKVTFSTQMAIYAPTTNEPGWFNWAFWNTEGNLLFNLQFPAGSGAQTIF